VLRPRRPGLKYRLGNECDIYAEIAFVQTMKLDGVEAKLNFMPVLWNGASDTARSGWTSRNSSRA